MKAPTMKQWAKAFYSLSAKHHIGTKTRRKIVIGSFEPWPPNAFATLTIHRSGRITRTLNGKKVGP